MKIQRLQCRKVEILQSTQVHPGTREIYVPETTEKREKERNRRRDLQENVKFSREKREKEKERKTQCENGEKPEQREKETVRPRDQE